MTLYPGFSENIAYVVFQKLDVWGSGFWTLGVWGSFSGFGVFGHSGFGVHFLDVRGSDVGGPFSDVRGSNSFSDVRGFRSF